MVALRMTRQEANRFWPGVRAAWADLVGFSAVIKGSGT
jgi:hypothetical protein